MKAYNRAAYEWLLVVGIGIALIFLVNPFHIWMPSAVELTLVMMLALFAIGFAAFIWRERPRDEREAQQSSRVGRASYLAGGLVLTIGIVYQSSVHQLDLWLVAALGTMVLLKLMLGLWMDGK
jgi:uncharacterized membrane protein